MNTKMTLKTELSLPAEDNITLEWLWRKVPVKYWCSLIILMTMCFLAGVYVGQVSWIKELVGIKNIKQVPINTFSESIPSEEILKDPKTHIEQKSEGGQSQNIVTKGNVDIRIGNGKQ